MRSREVEAVEITSALWAAIDDAVSVWWQSRRRRNRRGIATTLRPRKMLAACGTASVASDSQDRSRERPAKR